jgi:FkbM family methyltransferase
MGAPTELLDFVLIKPSYFMHAGIGPKHPEIEVIRRKFPDVIIHGFEPTSEICDIIADTYPGVCHNMALGSVEGLTTFYKDGPTSLAWNVRDVCKSYNIPCTTLDSFCKGMSIKDNIILWADVEGCELDILKGCKSLLSTKAITYIILELWSDTPLDKALHWCKDHQVISFLRSYDYRMFHKTSEEHYHSWGGPDCNVRGNHFTNKYDAIFTTKED